MSPPSGLLVLLLVAGCAHPQATPTAAPAATAKPGFSMRMYYMAFLRRGPAWTAEDTEVSAAHMAHIEAMAKSGKLVVAGPFEQGAEAPTGALAGIFIFDVPTLEEAVTLASEDPAVQAGRFTVEVLGWWGPAGLTYAGR